MCYKLSPAALEPNSLSAGGTLCATVTKPQSDLGLPPRGRARSPVNQVQGEARKAGKKRKKKKGHILEFCCKKLDWFKAKGKMEKERKKGKKGKGEGGEGRGPTREPEP